MNPRSMSWPLGLVLATVGCHRERATVSADPIAPADPLEAAVASIRGEDLAAHVQILASDAFGGRFPGSPGEAKTVAYISAQFARHGLEPGVDGSYLQPVPLVSVTMSPSTRATLVHLDAPRSLTVPEQLVISSPLAETRVELADAELVFAGYGITAPEYGWDDYASLDPEGKVVVVLPGDPGHSRDDPAFFDGRALTVYGTSAHKAEQAAAHGAAALLTLYTPETLGVPWDVLAQGARLPHQQLAEPDGPPKVPVVGLVPLSTLEDALPDSDRQAFAEGRSAAAEDGFTARSLPLRLSVELQRQVEPVVSHNVVGILRGRGRPREHIVYTAHWDHIGRAENGTDVYNGAVDNATGTAALLELAEAFAALPQPPARSVVLVATTAEEQGLLGAKHYTEHPVLPLADTVGVINMDALFPFGETGGMTVVALGSSELEDYMAEAARSVGRRLFPDPSPELGAFFRSDHYPFANRGVPAIFAVGGPVPDPRVDQAALLARFAEFLQSRYHQVGDEYDEATWDMAGIVQDVTIYFRTGYAIAMDERRPQWRPGSPFRARHEALRREARLSAGYSRSASK